MMDRETDSDMPLETILFMAHTYFTSYSVPLKKPCCRATVSVGLGLAWRRTARADHLQRDNLLAKSLAWTREMALMDDTGRPAAVQREPGGRERCVGC
jgi:hypothetical protein